MNGGATIGLAFGLVWWLVGAAALGPPERPALQAGGVLLFAGAALRVRGRRRAPAAATRWRFYIAAVVAEIAAIALAVPWLNAHGRADAVFPVVGVIVGLHFVGLHAAFARPRFLALAVAMTLINLFALTPWIAAGSRNAVAGFGSAVALLVSATLP